MGEFMNMPEGAAHWLPLLKAELAGKASGNAAGDAYNALKLGGIAAAEYSRISEGVFSPALHVDGGEAVGYTNRSGVYYKMGKAVFFQLSLSLSPYGGLTNEDWIIIEGLPFAHDGNIGIIDLNITNILLDFGNQDYPVFSAYFHENKIQLLHLNTHGNYPALLKGHLNENPANCHFSVRGIYTTNG